MQFNRGVSWAPLAAALTICWLAPVRQASAQTTPIFRMDCQNGAAYPNCGFSGTQQNSQYTLSRLAGQCPSGRDAVRLTVVPQSTHSQPYIGWYENSLESQTVPQGATRYFRVRVRPVGTQNYIGTGDVWMTKWVIHGVEAGRSIIWYGIGQNESTTITGATKNISGLGAGNFVVAQDQWANLQYEIRSSSSRSASDAGIKAWKNQNAYGSPTSQGSGFNLTTDGWEGGTLLGGYAGTTLRSGGRAVFDVCDFEYDDQFDPNWNIGGGGGGGGTGGSPGTPTGVRVVASGAGLVLFPAAWYVGRRRRVR